MISINSTNFDLNQCKENGISFYKAACVIEDSSKDPEWMSDVIIPFTVNIMFSCELLLKYLLFPCLNSSEMNIIRSHSIYNLYNELKKRNNVVTDQIEDYYYKNAIAENRNQNTLDAALKMCDKNFESFRYSHESTSTLKMHLSSIPTFAQALIKVSHE